MSARLERQLADLFGGYDGGSTLWELACRKLARSAAAAADDEYRFRSHPAGALNKLLVDVREALQVAELAVELQAVLSADADAVGDDDRRRGEIADMLLDRAREVSDAKMTTPETYATAVAHNPPKSRAIAATQRARVGEPHG